MDLIKTALSDVTFVNVRFDNAKSKQTKKFVGAQTPSDLNSSSHLSHSKYIYLGKKINNFFFFLNIVSTLCSYI
jgi:hypothetical protein